MNKQTISFVAGKSGGHIIPCLTLAKKYLHENPDLHILFFSANTPLDKLILSKEQRITQHIMLSLVSANPQSFMHAFTIVWNVFSSFCRSLFYLYKNKPSKIITTGGVVAIPTCIAAFFLRIPIIIYSLDAVPGKAIKALIPFSSKIMVCFKNSEHFFPSQKCSITPFPIQYTQNDTILRQEDVLYKIGLHAHKQTILILGGSQGSLFLNNCIKEWVLSSHFSKDTTQIIHQTGATDTTNWHDFYVQQDITAHVFSYNPNLALFYNSADLIICRAGAGTLFEIEFFKKTCLIIPLRSKTTTHQVDNAQAMSQEYPHHFAWIDQKDIEPNLSLFFIKVNELLER